MKLRMDREAEVVWSEVILAPQQRWSITEARYGRVSHPEFRPTPQEVIALLNTPDPQWETVLDLAQRQPQGFGWIVETEAWLLALADKIRSIPVFYAQEGNRTLASNAPRSLVGPASLSRKSEAALLEFEMAGYCLGSKTVFEGLHQVPAGTYMLRECGTPEATTGAYYRYIPVERSEVSKRALIEEFAAVNDDLFRSIIRRANGRPLAIPLSGGLDSRLILAKLRELGAPELQSFSYGPAGNHEAACAREVAERLGVPWFDAVLPAGRARQYYRSEERRAYWQFADGLSSIPAMAEAPVLTDLIRTGRLSEDAIVINGQSGDFISGDHIPRALSDEATIEQATAEILGKHFSLWRDLRSAPNLAAIRDTLDAFVAEAPPEALASAPGFHEYWEWFERQTKYVVNGQRLYDFLGLQWELPLWSTEYLAFWRKVPLGHRLGQRLYRDYLEAYDYHGLFSANPPGNAARATVGWKFYPIHGVSKILELLRLPKTQKRYRNIMRYFGYYGPQYRSFSFLRFLRQGAAHRNPASLFARDWLRELDEEYPF